MIAQLLAIIIATAPFSGVTNFEVTLKHCAAIRKILPDSRCVKDTRMLTMHVESRSDFEDPLIREVIGLEMMAWFGAGGKLFTLHFRKQDEFIVCMTRVGGFTCWNAERAEKEVDSVPSNAQDALEDLP